MKFRTQHRRFRMRVAMTLLSLLCAATAKPLILPTSFEIASVKKSPPNHGMASVRPWGSDTFSATNVGLDYLLQLAFGKHPYEIIGLPSWIGSEAYDVNAKMGGGALLTWRVAREPLQDLLRERFQLKTHYEKKIVSGYALVTVKSGLKLKPVEGAISRAYVGNGSIHGEYIHMVGVATLLATATGRPVTDQTGIEGLYDIDLRFASTGADQSLPDLFTAVQEQLGLKLQPAKIPLDILIVDNLNRNPTED